VVSLSGGRDSTAVFGVAQHVLGLRAAGQVRSVSISFPLDDPGREDDFIQEVAAFWSASPHWLSISDIPFFRHPVEEAALRDEPFVHPFQHWNTALAEAGRSLGARVLLDGYGGDQLFSVSNAFLAGLLRQGQWRQFLIEARRVLPRGNFRARFQLGVLPILPAWLLELAMAMRGGRPLAGYLQHTPAPWIRRDFIERHDLRGRQNRIAPPGEAPGPPVTELKYYLTAPFFPTIISLASRYSLDAGVEQRSPLYDREIIAFAAGRPISDKNSPEGTKRILRQSVRGLLPETVLATRRTKTGTTNTSFLRAMRRDFPPLAERAFAEPILPELGVVDLPCLRGAVDDFARGIGADIATSLYFTLQTELWLRARAGI
jgi:asparagine synthase (glutamine-hydrolysing)